jgi:hypothetical protein
MPAGASWSSEWRSAYWGGGRMEMDWGRRIRRRDRMRYVDGIVLVFDIFVIIDMFNK